MIKKDRLKLLIILLVLGISMYAGTMISDYLSESCSDIAESEGGSWRIENGKCIVEVCSFRNAYDGPYRAKWIVTNCTEEVWNT